MTAFRFATAVFIALAFSPAWLRAEGPFVPQAAGSPEGRFGGFVWLDIDGDPLPFQTDAEIEDFLLTAEVTGSTVLGEGITMPRRLELTKDGTTAFAVYKDVEVERHKVTERTCGRSRFYLDWRDSHTYDNAAYVLDRMLGLYRVPPAVGRDFGGSSGTLVMWVGGTMTESDRRRLGLQPPDSTAWNRQMEILHVFNNLIARRDVNPGNTLIDSYWRVGFIDSTRAFGSVDDLVCPDAIRSCERGLFERLQALDPARVRRELAPYLSRGETNALLVRREKLVAYLLELIDERGEEAIIFDMIPPETTGN
jgi:hypothetical protein